MESVPPGRKAKWGIFVRAETGCGQSLYTRGAASAIPEILDYDTTLAPRDTFLVPHLKAKSLERTSTA
jgi:hypothetical protein